MRTIACLMLVGIGLGLELALPAAVVYGAEAGGVLAIPLTVEEPAGVARRGAPVVGGIPLPRGQVPADQPFSLFDGPAELPLQTAPLVVDPDGTLRWVLLNFPLDIDANQIRHLELRLRSGQAQPSPALRIAESGQFVEVDTGRLRFRLSKSQPFSLIEEAEVGGRAVASGGEIQVTDGRTGEVFLAGKPREVLLEHSGPLRVTIRVEGDYEGSALRYITRLTAWAGRTDIRIQHILANSNSRQVSHACVARASVALRHMLGSDVELSPDVERTGALKLRGGEAAIFVCDRDYLGDGPRRLAVEGDRIVAEFITPRSIGRLFRSEHAWLYDLSHKTLDLLVDFAPAEEGEAALRSRLLAVAPGGWYSRCEALGVGRFGTLEDEIAVYRNWGWAFDPKQLPKLPHDPNAYVRWEDNHYESEADSVEALLLMFVRTGQRGYFDLGEAWARYHCDLQTWRSDGWVYDDGAIWFPQGGPLGSRPVRKPADFEYQKWNKGSPDDQELWRLVQAKACYCHFYGAGLVDYFLLTGERDALEAALDLAEIKNSEYRKHRQFSPGETTIVDTRGFGRGFYVVTRLLEAQPDNKFLLDLAKLCRDVLWQCPNMDERGFLPHLVGEGFDARKNVPPEMKAFMDREGITLDEKGWMSDKAGRRWPVVSLGGTWQHAYVQAAAELYARRFADEDMADFTVAFGRFAGRYLLSAKCHQTPYQAYMDVPIRGEPFDPWMFEAEHVATRDGEGCRHSGWYTRFLPDAMARAYSFTGDEALLVRAREFWHYGSKRGYRTLAMSAGWDRVGAFANHRPPKDDSVLSTSRMFYAWSHPRSDRSPPEPIQDLAVSLLGDGRARVRFTAPRDDGGATARYQVKCAERPIVDDAQFDFARDEGHRRSFWRAINLAGEPGSTPDRCPAPPGRPEDFVVTGVPAGAGQWHFVAASYDAAGNRSPLSNVVALPPVQE